MAKMKFWIRGKSLKFFENGGICKANGGICIGNLLIFVENCGFLHCGAILIINTLIRMARFRRKIRESDAMFITNAS